MDPRLKLMAVHMLKRHEGVRTYVYKDHLGHETAGVGRRLANGFRDSEIELMLVNDLEYAYTHLKKKYEWFWKLNLPRQLALINMAFQLGLNGFSKFVKMINALKEQDYEGAADQMLLSRWAKQTPNRAMELAKIVKTGEME